MPMNRKRVEFFKTLLAEIDSDGRALNDFERSFMADQKQRFEKYGADTFFSSKQWSIVMRVATEKYSLEEDDAGDE